MPAHSFSLVAPFYDPLSRVVFGSSLYRSQLAWLPVIPPGSRVLLIGGGTGRILPTLLEQGRCRELHYLEASARMLGKARQIVAGLPGAGRIVFRVGTEEDLAPGENFDVVLTFFFLDLFSPPLLQQVSSRLLGCLKPGGWWLVSDFVPPGETGFKRLGARLLFSAMYRFFRISCGISATTLPDWPGQLAGYGLKPVKSCYFYRGLIRAAAFQKPGA